MRAATFLFILLFSSFSLADSSTRTHEGKDKLSLSASLKSPIKELRINGKVQLPRYVRVSKAKGSYGRYYSRIVLDNSIECNYSAKKRSLGQYFANDYKLYFQGCNDGESVRKVRDVEEVIELSVKGKTYFGKSPLVVKANFLVENAVTETEGIELEGVKAVAGQVLQYNGELWVAGDIAEGSKGETGEQGLQGEKGDTGADGAQGIQGVAGADGTQGLQGEKGDTGAQGIQGVTGADGAQGLQGEKGDTGAQGIQGVAGADGAQGLQGEKGDTGAQGIQGVAGADGAQGLQGEKGDTGAQGLQGVAGAQGVQGEKGETGPQGLQGEKGDTGAQGIQGLPGIAGAAGEVGPQGVAGKDANVSLSAGVGIKGEIVNGVGEVSVDVGTGPGQIAQLGVDGRLPASILPDMGSSTKVAYIKDLKPSGTHGGDCVAGAYVKRDLNSISGDSTFVSIANNQIFLAPGTYRFDISAPGYLENLHKAKLVNTTSGQTVLIGTTERSHVQYGGVSHSKIIGEVIISEASSFEIQHRCTTSRTIVGFGVASSFGEDEVYTQVKVEKVK
jgi:hypothetical protein